METLSSEAFKSLNESLKEINTCPICFGYLRPTTVICVNGHVICEACKQEQTKCPTCRENFSNVKRTGFIRQILEVLPHTCRHKNCDYYVTFGDDHELYCGFKPTTCKKCDWTGPAQNILAHLKDDHPAQGRI